MGESTEDDDEVAQQLRDVYEQHVDPVLFGLVSDSSLGSELWQVRMNGQRLAQFRRRLGEERYERLIKPIREEWAAKFREAQAYARDRDELEAEIRATMEERHQVVRSGAEGPPDSDDDRFLDNDLDD